MKTRQALLSRCEEPDQRSSCRSGTKTFIGDDFEAGLGAILLKRGKRSIAVDVIVADEGDLL